MPGRMEAVYHVTLEARPGRMDDMCRFYVEFAGLEWIGRDPTGGVPWGDPQLRDLPTGSAVLKSSILRLVIRPSESPQPEPLRRRLTIRVPDLHALAQALDDAGLAYRQASGSMTTDNAILVPDPAGHVVEFRRHWPPI